MHDPPLLYLRCVLPGPMKKSLLITREADKCDICAWIKIASTHDLVGNILSVLHNVILFNSHYKPHEVCMSLSPVFKQITESQRGLLAQGHTPSKWIQAV